MRVPNHSKDGRASPVSIQRGDSCWPRPIRLTINPSDNHVPALFDGIPLAELARRPRDVATLASGFAGHVRGVDGVIDVAELGGELVDEPKGLVVGVGFPLLHSEIDLQDALVHADPSYLNRWRAKVDAREEPLTRKPRPTKRLDEVSPSWMPSLAEVLA